jgi:carboxymethylenebutenolidase
MGEMIEFQVMARPRRGIVAVPEGGTGPGLIVIQEWWGLVEHIKEVCDRFAAAGFVAWPPTCTTG